MRRLPEEMPEMQRGRGGDGTARGFGGGTHDKGEESEADRAFDEQAMPWWVGKLDGDTRLSSHQYQRGRDLIVAACLQ